MIAAAKVDLPVDRQLASLNLEAYALDSTTIDLCLKLFPWAAFRRRKGGLKAHTLFDLRLEIPVFLRVTSAKTHDVAALDWITPAAGAYYVFDMAYIDFARLWRLHGARALFVSRAKRNMDFAVRKRLPPDPAAGVRSDRLIRLRGIKSRKLYPDTLRLIRYVEARRWKTPSFSHQQPHACGDHDRAAVSQAVADRVVFQMDQTASAYQGSFWHDAQCREGPIVGP